jgi:hypothetical protein
MYGPEPAYDNHYLIKQIWFKLNVFLIWLLIYISLIYVKMI